MTYHSKFNDHLINFISGLGVPGRDKAVSSQWSYNLTSQTDVEIAYRTNWIARKLVDIPAYDATRAWRKWETDTNKIEKIEKEEERINFQRVLRNGLIMSRLYGGAALVMGVDQGKASEELDIKKINKGALKFIIATSRWGIGTGPLETDILSPNYGRPKYFTRLMGTATNTDAEFQIHPSRVVVLQGMGLPDPISSGDIWGDSILQVALDAVQGATGVVQAVATMVQESKIDVIKIPDLSQNLSSTDYANELVSRFQLANTAKSLINTLLLDKEEEWNRISADMAGLPEILKMFLLMVSGAADIPATRMLGQSPVGLNATGDGDLRNYYDRIHSDQNNTLSPALAMLDDVLLASALGSRNPSIYYEWNNLWQMSEEEKANLAILKAKTFQIDAMVGLVDPEALRIGRQNQLIEDGFYPGLEEALEEQDQLGLESISSPEEQQAEEAAMLAQQAAATLSGTGAPGPKAPPIKGPNKSPATRDSKKKLEDYNHEHDPDNGRFAETGEGGEKGTVGKIGRGGKRQESLIKGFGPTTIKASQNKVTKVKEVKNQRVYAGKSVPITKKLTKQQTGDLAEKVGIMYLRKFISKDAAHLKPGVPNYPVDLRAGDNLVEVKGGLVSNKSGSDQWRNNIGGLTPLQTKLQRELSPKELRAHNDEKRASIERRKLEVVKELSKETGRKLKPVTVTMIINPDTQTADVYEIPGFHQRTGWKAAAQHFKRTIRYELDE